MDRLALRQKSAKKALDAFYEVLQIQEISTVVRDAAIQRFEFTLEAVWKFAQHYLKEKEGVLSNSPKAVIRSCLQQGLCTHEQAEELLSAIDDRNLTLHTYHEELAEKIFYTLKKRYSLFLELYDAIANR